MIKQIQITCPSCDAVFTIHHDMDGTMYIPKGCVFCLEPIDDKELINFYKWDEDEETWVMA